MTGSHKRGIAAALLLVIAAAALFLAWGGSSTVDGTRPEDAALVAEGRQLYERHCAACHGLDLEGQENWREAAADGSRPAPPHDESGHTWHHPDATLFRIVKEGGASVAQGLYRSNMPAFGEVLSDEEIWATLSYIKSRWPTDIRELHDEMNRQQP